VDSLAALRARSPALRDEESKLIPLKRFP